MASSNGYDDVPMLPVSCTSSSSRTRPFTFRSRSVSLSNTSSTIDVFENSSTVVLSYTDPLGTQRQPQLVQMGDPISSTRNLELVSKHAHPYGTTCPSDYNREAAQIPTPRVSDSMDGLCSGMDYILCLFMLVSGKCIRIDEDMAIVLVALRSLTDVLYFVNILLQFRLAYTDPETTVVGSGKLVKDTVKIARRYYRGNFLLDLLIVIPLPQILIVWIIPHVLVIYGANTIKNLLCTAVVVQCIPKLHRLFHLLARKRTTGFIFESAWASFFINLFTFILAGHIVGSCWYLFGLQRVNQCLRETCEDHMELKCHGVCKELIDCGLHLKEKLIDCERRNTTVTQAVLNWNVTAAACFQENGFRYGIYWKAVNLTHDSNLPEKYIYSLFWGFQQISTLGGNQVPSYFIWEVLFTMAIIGLGLFLFALLIGNMQNFLQSLGRRNMEMTLRRRDVNKWMSHRQFPEVIRERVRDSERLNWSATRGVHEELLFENMPDDLQRDIRRHLFAFLKKVRIFSKMDDSILDAIRERLKHKTYVNGSMVLHRGDLVKKMVIIVRGTMESIGEDGYRTVLSEEFVCGEELLTWCQERSSVNPDGTMIRMPSKGLISSRAVWCVTNVEAFSLSVADLEDIMSLFPNLEIPKEP
ncbi:unnamed protein product [Brassica oleracea]|uniref:(rape) hypothetical protein n=1 Tax=Brassica napus TaxID=3708 RepID=A0A816IES9_BRANA|nr:unnamed protein product [Brassica napus]